MNALYIMATLASGQIVEWRGLEGLSTNPINRVYSVILIVWWLRAMVACGDKKQHSQLTKELLALVIAAVFIGILQPHETAVSWFMQ